MNGILTALFPLLAMATFVWILMKWEAWGTTKALPITVGWAVLMAGVGMML
jgi:hypothetical protein